MDVQVWTIQKIIDYEAYGADPSYYVNHLQRSSLLDPLFIVTQYLYIANNVYDNLDHWWPFSDRFDGNFYQVDKIISRPRVASLEPE